MDDHSARLPFPLATAALLGAAAAIAVYLINGASDLLKAGAAEHARALFWHAATGAAAFVTGAGWHNRKVQKVALLPDTGERSLIA